MLIPRRLKHRKQHHPKRSGAAKGGTTISFGDYGIQALEPAYVTNRQIEAARIAMTRHIKRGGKVWINIYPDRPLTKKPAETRMGSGKGSPSGGSPTSSPDASCSSSPVSTRNWPARPCAVRSTSSR
ncbi:hypothetical protein GCM10025864_04790 [Luteimicrobium album]|uniref:50S ribosomal protein L16 n=1 Tax=Luteimicrobium album TaxID=1054550 RepID=A0ABQ6HW50_9MICO|nr:hypothetical protein GCM10025864_04790 [Luteimicrobium album]